MGTQKKEILLVLALMLGGTALAQVPSSQDSIPVSNKEEKSRNVMLNASDASKPREVNIGLPGTEGGTEIFEGGLPVVYYSWPFMLYMNWRGGNAYDKNGLMSFSESALLSGDVRYTVNSESRLGGEQTEAHLTYSLNHFRA